MWFYSNCLLVALIIRVRKRGVLVMRCSKIYVIPHFVVISDNKVLDFTSRARDKPWYKEIWFKGRIRTRSLRAFNYERIKKDLVDVYLF